jgi:hypothetical protein
VKIVKYNKTNIFPKKSYGYTTGLAPIQNNKNVSPIKMLRTIFPKLMNMKWIPVSLSKKKESAAKSKIIISIKITPPNLLGTERRTA